MRKRIRALALAVVAIGAGTLSVPREAYATYATPPTILYCCCQIAYGACMNRCCSPRGCSINADGCNTYRT